MRSPASTRAPTAVALACGALGLALTLWMPPGVFSGDEGVKLIQSQALVHNGWTSLELPYPGTAADPEGLHFPLSPPFLWQSNGSRFGIYSFEYTAAAALFWRFGGLRGVFLLSWLGAAVALVLTASLARRLTTPARAAAVVLAAALATPLLLYGTTNYEHTWGCALILALLLLLADARPRSGRLLAAGALLGLAAAIRPELSLFAPAVAGFTIVYWGPRATTLVRLALVGSAAAVVAALYLALNFVFFGNLHPNLMASDHPETSWQSSLEMLLAPAAPGWASWVPVAAAALGVLPAGATAWSRLRAAGSVLVIGLLVIVAWRALAAVTPGMFAGTRSLVGLFTATPVAVLGLLRGPGRGVGNLGGALAAAAVLYIVGVLLVRTPGFWGGLEMGSRYLLPAALLLLLAATDFFERAAPAAPRSLTVSLAAILCALSVAATIQNARCMHAIRQFSAELVAAVESSGVDDVVVGQPWAAQVLAPLYLEKRIYRPASNFLYPALYAEGGRRFLAVYSGQGVGRFRRIVLARERVIAPDVVVFSLTRVPPGGWEQEPRPKTRESAG